MENLVDEAQSWDGGCYCHHAAVAVGRNLAVGSPLPPQRPPGRHGTVLNGCNVSRVLINTVTLNTVPIRHMLQLRAIEAALLLLLRPDPGQAEGQGAEHHQETRHRLVSTGGYLLTIH